MSSQTSGITRIVVLGGGFAGAYCVKQLEKRLRGRDISITLVNEQNNFVFTPMLVEAATSALEARHVIVSLREFLKSSEFVMAAVESIDLKQQIVTMRPSLSDPISLSYDHLVFALGSVTKMPGVPGANKFAFPLKSLADATQLRDRAIGMLEMANLCKERLQKDTQYTHWECDQMGEVGGQHPPVFG